ncbi:hypothetical protein [Cupriavidus sp. UME77]|uniref:hypothetical protein n=1 Tax=Cupriavidus sp. UME77 TaxID=1862321 RepID=UPI001602FF31|nr:hypothetical protein [Cupriavidus sp. UME77]MBB1634239.1 hypothetical protein [Cupriavidus sp. UME77]MBB1634543.1 hypothetical protein [Cupriavidus sp. UME77]
MRSDTTNLHAIVAKWIGPAEGRPVRVARFGRMCTGRVPYVGVEREADMLFFFRHGDGSWCVFPPASQGTAARSA